MNNLIPAIAHRLVNWRYKLGPDSVLNSGPPPSGASGPVAAEMKRAINALKAAAFDTARGRVDYATLADHAAYAEYRDCSRRLRAFDLHQLASDEERLAFWINLYNALVVDAVIAFGVERSVNEVAGFFWKAAYRIGDHRFSTFDIEYGVLRANAGHPAIPGPQFGPHDPRRELNLQRLDPRVHFALVCAARSCPPIAVYDAGRIHEQLDLAARAFVNGGGVRVNSNGREVQLSRIFQWYAPDFGGPALGLGNMRPVLRYLAPFADQENVKAALQGENGRLRVRFMPYDWALNV